MIHHTPIQLKSYEDFLSKFKASTPICLLCQLRYVNCQSSYWKATECTFTENENENEVPVNNTEVQVTVKAEALNSLENFPVEFVYFFPNQEGKAFYKSLENILNTECAIIVSAPIYYLIEGDLVLLSLSLTPTTCPTADLGYSTFEEGSH